MDSTPPIRATNWQSLVAESVMAFGIDIPSATRFHGAIDSRHYFDLDLFSMSCERHAARRSRAHIRNGSDATVVITAQRSGTLVLRQFDDEAMIRPGEFAAYISTEPVDIEGSDDYESLCARIPLDRLGISADELRPALATGFDAGDGAAPAIWAYLQQLAAIDPRSMTATTAATMSHHAVGLIERLLRDGTGDGSAQQTETPRAAQLNRCRAYIERNLSDPGLSPDRIAEATFISTRYLHNLFGDTETTVAAYVRERRVERVLADLRDPTQANTSIDRIMRNRGVTNVSHFGQVVKKSLGYTPAAYRRNALGH